MSLTLKKFAMDMAVGMIIIRNVNVKTNVNVRKKRIVDVMTIAK